MSSIDLEVSVPSAEELKNAKTEYEKAPLQDGVYICRVNKVELRRVPSYWLDKKPDYSKMKLEWQAILSPVKQLSWDPLVNVNGTTVSPLSALIWKKANPFAMWMKQDGTPSNLRALFAYSLGVPVDGEFKVTKIVVVNKNEEVATEEETKAYAEEFLRLRKGEILPDQAKMRNEGFKHVPDLSVIEGKYVSATLAAGGEYNSVNSLSKIPMSFDPEKTDETYAEEIKKFNEVIYPRITESRKTKASGMVAGAKNVAPTDVREEEILLEDIPF